VSSVRKAPLSKANQGTTAELSYEWVPRKKKSSVEGKNETSAIAGIRGNAIERGTSCQRVHPAVTLHTDGTKCINIKTSVSDSQPLTELLCPHSDFPKTSRASKAETSNKCRC
jgi:hypothetical protein